MTWAHTSVPLQQLIHFVWLWNMLLQNIHKNITSYNNNQRG